MESRDLRSWMAEVENLGELKRIDGADWDVEIGAVTTTSRVIRKVFVSSQIPSIRLSAWLQL